MWIMKLIECLKQSTMPKWAYGLECQMCKKTFVSPEAHRKHATQQKTIKKHKGKIPVLRRK